MNTTPLGMPLVKTDEAVAPRTAYGLPVRTDPLRNGYVYTGPVGEPYHDPTSNRFYVRLADGSIRRLIAVTVGGKTVLQLAGRGEPKGGRRRR